MKKFFCLLLTALLLTGCAAQKSDSYTSLAGNATPPQSESAPAPSAPAGPKVVGYRFTPPEGFTPAKDNENLYYSPEYPDDISNVVTAVSDRDPYFDSYDADLMTTALNTALAGQLGNGFADLVVDSFGYFEVCGLPAWRLDMHYTCDGLTLRQTVVSVNADKCYAFTYTQTDETRWDALFDASINALYFEVG